MESKITRSEKVFGDEKGSHLFVEEQKRKETTNDSRFQFTADFKDDIDEKMLEKPKTHQQVLLMYFSQDFVRIPYSAKDLCHFIQGTFCNDKRIKMGQNGIEGNG